MPTNTDAPLKVSKHTKEKVRLGAAIHACTQGEFVERAVADYLERNAGDLKRRVALAHNALLGGDDEVIAYLLDVDVEKVRRVAPQATPR